MRPLGSIVFLAGLILLSFTAPLRAQTEQGELERQWSEVVQACLTEAEAAQLDGRHDEASQHYTAALEAAVAEGASPKAQSELLALHGHALRHAERFEDARATFRAASELLGVDPAFELDRADMVRWLAVTDFQAGNPERGERLFGEAIGTYARAAGPADSKTIEIHTSLAYWLNEADDAEGSKQAALAVEGSCLQVFGASEELSACMDQVNEELWFQPEAEIHRRIRKVLEVRESLTARDSPQRLDAMLSAASALYMADDDEGAVELYRQTLAALERRPDRRREAQARSGLADALTYLDRPAEAVEEFRIALALEDALGADANTRIDLLQRAAEALRGADENEEAFELLERSVSIARTEHGDPSDELTSTLNHISYRYQDEGWHDDARRILAERLLQLARDGESESMAVADIQERLGDMAASEANPEQAVVHFERMVQIQGSVWGEESAELIPSLGKLSQAYVNAERPADANAVNLRISRIGMVVAREQLSMFSKDFKLFGLPGFVVLLAGFVGVGAFVVVGGVALTRRLARVEPNASGETRVAFRIVGSQPRNPKQGSFEGQGGEVFGIWIVNMLLTVVTLGIYHFWAKVRMRRYIWAHSGLGDDRFAFHGTPQELFLGWLKGAPLLVFILYGPTIAQLAGVSVFAAQMIALAAFGLALLLWPIAEVGAHRYRLTRSSWRGIRFAFDGSAWRYLGIYLLNWPLWLFTLGLWTPFFNAYKRRFLIGHMSFGNSLFRCEARGRELFWRYALNWILFIPTLGMYGFWYRAYRERYYWSRTTFRGARFRCTVTGGQLFEIYGVGALLVLMSLGLAWPWVHARRLKVWLESIHVDGNLDLESVRQRAQDDTAVGEGFADFLGLDMGFLA